MWIYRVVQPIPCAPSSLIKFFLGKMRRESWFRKHYFFESRKIKHFFGKKLKATQQKGKRFHVWIYRVVQPTPYAPVRFNSLSLRGGACWFDGAVHSVGVSAYNPMDSRRIPKNFLGSLQSNQSPPWTAGTKLLGATDLHQNLRESQVGIEPMPSAWEASAVPSKLHRTRCITSWFFLF